MKTKWNLALFYKNEHDPRIRKDLERTKRAYLAFEKKYRGKNDYLHSVSKLLHALEDYEKLVETASSVKFLLFYFYTKEIDGSNSYAQAQVSKLTSELLPYENKVLFFDLALGKIDKKKQKQFLQDKKLFKYHYFLKRVFETSRYNLSESEEKILNLKSLPSHELWVEGLEKLLNKQTVYFKGKDLPIAEAQNKVSQLDTKERRVLQDGVMSTLKTMSDFAESEINAVYTNKKINDELRGFKEPYSATILGYENDEKSVLNLTQTITKHFHISNRFFKLKKKLLKLDHLAYADRTANIGKVKRKFTFATSKKLLRDVLHTVDGEYVNILNRFLSEGHIDVYPKVGKSGGAYCSSNVGTPTMVLLNHVDDLRSFTTLAHEMGHAIHAEMSKKQPVLYQGHSTAVAETASTFFEQLAFERMFEELSPKERIIALHDRINDDISTIFRQIACFNFEYDLHTQIREKGYLPKEDIARLLNKHMKSYMGPSFKLKDLDGYFFVQWSHIRRFFYVYSYAYGQLISKIMLEMFKKDSSYSREIKNFLTAGNSKSPERIFQDIGIDTTKPAFFKRGLESIENDIIRLEELTKSSKK